MQSHFWAPGARALACVMRQGLRIRRTWGLQTLDIGHRTTDLDDDDDMMALAAALVSPAPVDRSMERASCAARRL